MLESISKADSPSQRQLSKAAGISPSVTNKYLGEFEDKGLLTRSSLNERDYSYQLTDKGKRKKRELMVKYIRETFQMFSEGKTELGEKLREYQQDHGFEDVIFYSAGEVTDYLSTL